MSRLLEFLNLCTGLGSTDVAVPSNVGELPVAANQTVSNCKEYCTPDFACKDCRCGQKFSEKSELECVLPWEHGGSHSFSYPKSRVLETQVIDAKPKHEYLVRNTGLFKCCKMYLADLIGRAAKEDWPVYQEGFKTRCPECKAWIRLKAGQTFSYDWKGTP